MGSIGSTYGFRVLGNTNYVEDYCGWDDEGSLTTNLGASRTLTRDHGHYRLGWARAEGLELSLRKRGRTAQEKQLKGIDTFGRRRKAESVVPAQLIRRQTSSRPAPSDLRIVFVCAVAAASCAATEVL
ncbi:hypothetical protein AG1IA_09565 [Rhizoctonia solani AG-1 IA]|uniref:Uncharacterized protein n=1 Tax=Thanatephorus cucumeris (strain AG1-IA) TaxID=983506 RepID=L8WEM9_THACA|nr:hypothetical protein AG1IA_09565 [Rhizoctonia solani AG-1 IA]